MAPSRTDAFLAPSRTDAFMAPSRTDVMAPSRTYAFYGPVSYARVLWPRLVRTRFMAPSRTYAFYFEPEMLGGDSSQKCWGGVGLRDGGGGRGGG